MAALETLPMMPTRQTADESDDGQYRQSDRPLSLQRGAAGVKLDKRHGLTPLHAGSPLNCDRPPRGDGGCGAHRHDRAIPQQYELIER
jgi:hypothetical protein